MPKLRLVLLLLLLPALLPAQPVSSDDPRLKIDFWLKPPYLLVTQGEKYETATKVFKSLLAVADKPSKGAPELYIFSNLEFGKVFALPDGSIILPFNVLDFCLKDRLYGEARLAFVLGHEIKHAVRDDYWVQQLFEFARTLPKGQGNDQLQRALEEMQWGQSLEIRKSIETDADEYGILYASLAGYDVCSIISPTNSFISDYYRAARMNIYGDHLNNSVEERLKAVNRRLGEIVEHLDLFDFGVRLYAIGKHDAAIELLRKFASQYPSREVFNNLGLCYYQKALLAFSKWKQNERDQDYHFMYRVCMPLDPVTRLETPRRQIATNPRQVFQDAIVKAVENFQEAVTHDSDYETALNNLGCAYLLKGELDFAKGNFKKANEKNPYCKEAYNNLGVAYCAENNWSLAMTHFLAALSQQGDFLEPLFNLGVLSQQTGQIAKAKEYFEKYLQLDETSIYADAARKKLGLAAPNRLLTKTATNFKRGTLAATSGLQPGRWNQFLTPTAVISILHVAGQDTQYFQFEFKSSNEKIAILLTTASLPGVAADGVGIGAPENLLDEKYPYPYIVKPTTKGIFRTYERLGLVFEIRNHKIHSWYLYEVM